MGWARNRWVRLFAAALILWAAFDALVLLLMALFPGHTTPDGVYHLSTVGEFFQRYWSLMFWEGHPNWARLLALLRYGATIFVCIVAVWSLRPERNRPGISN